MPLSPEGVFIRSQASSLMLRGWEVMAAATQGDDYIKSLARVYLPQEPKEPTDAWQTRTARSLLTPHTSRIIENAAGLVLRRPIQITGPEFWVEKFAKNVDGIGSSLNEFARKILVASLRDGHSAVLVDYPSDAVAPNLLLQREVADRPYWIFVKAPQIYGWRQQSQQPYSPLSEVRIHEVVVREIDNLQYQEELADQMRVIKAPMNGAKGSYELHQHGKEMVSGEYDLSRIPLVPMYTNRMGMLLSQPLLIDVANMNIAHYRTLADRLHSLHLAAMQKLVLEGYEDSEADLGVNYAISMQPGNQAYWIKADAGSFMAQREMTQDLEMQMATLGVTKLLGQKFVAESADAKRIDQAQANSVLSIISMELENSLNQAFEMAAEYMSIEPPVVKIDRDFDFAKLLGQDVSVLGALHDNDQLPTETFLSILRHGEVLPDDADVEKLTAEVDRLRKARQERDAKQMEAKAKPPAGSPAGGRTDQVRRTDRGATSAGV